MRNGTLFYFHALSHALFHWHPAWSAAVMNCDLCYGEFRRDG